MTDLFSVIPILIVLTTVAILVSIVVRAGMGITEWMDNNSQPVLTEAVKVVGKRTHISGGHHHHHANSSMMHRSISTWYYVTFELPSGERREFRVSGKSYGQLTEGDECALTYQGTRLHGFERLV